MAGHVATPTDSEERGEDGEVVTYENDAAAPDVHFPARIEGVANYQLGGGVAGATTARLHQVALPGSIRLELVETHTFDELAVGQIQLLFLAKFFVGVKGVGEAKVGDDDVAVAVEKEIFEFEIAVDDAFFMEVSDTGHELSEKSPGGVVLQVAVGQDVVEQLAARSVLENDSNVPLGFHHLVQPDNVGMLDAAKDGNLAINLGQSRGIAPDGVSFDQFDGDLGFGRRSCQLFFRLF